MDHDTLQRGRSDRRDWLRTRYTWHDDVGKFSLASQLASLVNPRWGYLKDIGNEALKASEPMIASGWYMRAMKLTDVREAVSAFFEHMAELGEGNTRREARCC